MTTPPYAVILVYSTAHAIKAEKVIKTHQLSCKLIPVPRHLSSDCGVCVRIAASVVDEVTDMLHAGRVPFDAIHVLDA